MRGSAGEGKKKDEENESGAHFSKFDSPNSSQFMNTASFYLGLSFLSNDAVSGREAGSRRGDVSHREGRRILGLLDGGSPAALRTEILGRPYFADRHADFSVSHSGSMIAVSFLPERSAQTGFPLRTGCDIQYVNSRKNRDKIIRQFFSRAERVYIAAACAAQERLLRFYRIWVLKECFIKANGLSVFDMRKCPVFIFNTEQAAFYTYSRGVPDKIAHPWFTFYVYEYGRGASVGYVLAAARERNGPVSSSQPEVSWFSPDTLPLIRSAEINAVVSPVKTVRPKI
ncbi:MAG: 4'-phosphopantetheinyl transferase superfamily protein [Spirochaetales bacterium]|jgi:phosphopantetheinyl transferase (holo-ACP synthase)|nr:4'-phosphopantetheinyl transferase superfamily protein [Spirochaetales bacterium]